MSCCKGAAQQNVLRHGGYVSQPGREAGGYVAHVQAASQRSFGCMVCSSSAQPVQRLWTASMPCVCVHMAPLGGLAMTVGSAGVSLQLCAGACRLMSGLDYERLVLAAGGPLCRQGRRSRCTSSWALPLSSLSCMGAHAPAQSCFAAVTLQTVLRLLGTDTETPDWWQYRAFCHMQACIC